MTTDSDILAVAEHIKSLSHHPIERAVYEAFRRAIVTGSVSISKRINTTEYAQALHISRTPVRLALEKLVADGLVEHRPKVGFFACQITSDDVEEVYLIRKALEALVVNVATEKMSAEDFDELETLLKQTDEANQQGDIPRVLELFREYHSFMYKKSKLIRTAEIISRGNEYLQHFRSICLSSGDRRDIAIADHWAIYEAMKARDTQTTVELIERHLDASLEFLLLNLGKRGENHEHD